MVRSSTQPSSRSRWTKAAVHWLMAEAVPAPKNPIVGGFAECCALAASGHAAAAPPTSVMKSRRFTARCLPVLPTERIAHLGTADCCIHPPGRNEMIAITPPKIFSKEVPQKQATPFPRQDLPQHQKSFYAKFPGMRPG